MAEEKKKAYWLSFVITTLLIVGGIIAFTQFRKSKHITYYTYFYNIQGLQSSSPVQINGVRVGKISDIELQGDKLKIIMAINKETILPKGTTASLASGGIAGEKIIMLHTGKDSKLLEAYATIPSSYDTSVLPMSVRIKPMILSIKTVLNSTNTGLKGVTYIINGGLNRQAAEMLISIDEQTSKLKATAEKINAKGGAIAKTVHQAATNTQDMAVNVGNTRQSMKDFEKSSGKMAATPVSDNFKKLGNSISALGASFQKLGNVDSGGLGKLINKKDLYRNTTNALDTANKGMQDLYNRANATNK